MAKPTFALSHKPTFSLNAILFTALALAMCATLLSCQKSPSYQIYNACASAVCNISETIVFGHYNGDPITWIILDKNDNGQYLVVSEKILDMAQFDILDDFTPCKHHYQSTWDISTLRSWLNGYNNSYNCLGKDYTSDNFINAAFTAEERAKIIPTEILSKEHEWWNVDVYRKDWEASGGKGRGGQMAPPRTETIATTDKIFLLSHEEAGYYFASDETRRPEPTSYAKDKAKHVGRQPGAFEQVFLGASYDNQKAYQWWLRAPSGAYVKSSGGLFTYDDPRLGYEDAATTAPMGVRPALWVQY